MDDWIKVFDATFWLSLSVGIFGFMGILLRYCIKSKCTDCNLCFGLIQVRRDTQAELEESEFEIEHGVQPQPSPPQPNRF
jgi:hypothetical protein